MEVFLDAEPFYRAKHEPSLCGPRQFAFVPLGFHDASGRVTSDAQEQVSEFMSKHVSQYDAGSGATRTKPLDSVV